MTSSTAPEHYSDLSQATYGLVTPEDEKRYRAQVEEDSRARSEWLKSVRNDLEIAKAIYVKYFGENSNVVKYLSGRVSIFDIRGGPRDPSRNGWEHGVRRAREEAQAAEKAEQEKSAAAEERKAQHEFNTKLMEYLASKGVVVGRDVPFGEAYDKAMGIAEAEARPDPGQFIGFDGMNCDGPCRGWDGESRRCECGNRRVAWSWDYAQPWDGAPHAEAY